MHAHMLFNIYTEEINFITREFYQTDRFHFENKSTQSKLLSRINPSLWKYIVFIFGDTVRTWKEGVNTWIRFPWT